MRTLEKIALVGVLLTAALIALVRSGRLPEITKETSLPASLPPPPLEEWKTYTDERFHFTFKYPPDWYLNVIPADVSGGCVQISTFDLNTTAFLKETPPPEYFKMEIVVVAGDPRAPDQTIEEWRHARGDYDPSKPRQERHVMVANRDALEETGERLPGTQYTTIYIPYSDTVYGDTVLFISACPRLPILSEVFRQIVSTFQFVDAAEETSQPASLPPPPLEKWRTYTDERFHFTFKYPPDWYLNVLSAGVAGGGVQLSTYALDDTSFLKGTPPSDYLKVEVIVVGGDPRAPGQTIEEWRHARGDYDPSLPREERHVMVAGLDALEETVEDYPGMRGTAIYLPYSDPTYGDTALYISASTFRQPILSEVFRQIVSTFQFMK